MSLLDSRSNFFVLCFLFFSFLRLRREDDESLLSSLESVSDVVGSSSNAFNCAILLKLRKTILVDKKTFVFCTVKGNIVMSSAFICYKIFG